MTAAHDPYAPPAADLLKFDGEVARAEATRTEHLNHEASVRSVGSLYYLAAAMMLFASLGVMPILLQNTREEGAGSVMGMLVFYLAFGIAAIFIGRGLRTLRRWVKAPVGILSVIGLLGFPIGTIINGYILYLIFGAKGKMVFSDEYQEIIRQTPHIKYKTSVVILILLFTILALLAAAIIVPLIT